MKEKEIKMMKELKIELKKFPNCKRYFGDYLFHSNPENIFSFRKQTKFPQNIQSWTSIDIP